MATRAAAVSVDGSLATKLLPGVLRVVAGSVNVINFLGLGGLFAAHITGNLVVLAAHVATGRSASLTAILSVPVFIVVLGLTRLAAAGLEETRHCPLQPLLALQFVLLVSFWWSGSLRVPASIPVRHLAWLPACWGSLRWRCRTRSCSS